MRALETKSLLAGAATAAINQRVVAAYHHDLRGSLQALQGSMELLSRAGRNGAADAARLEKATSLAKRAVTNHATLVTRLLHRMVGGGSTEAAPEPVPPLQQLLQDAVVLLRHVAEEAQVEIDVTTGAGNAAPPSDPHATFGVILGLILTALDTHDRGERLALRLEEQGELLALTLPLGTRDRLDALPEGDIHDSRDLILGYARDFLHDCSGSLELTVSAAGAATLVARIPYLTA